ncbi:hypothetical protein NDU88_000924 [Pleurodeles waltl]|uniref:Uncharacterized protein n=1 Tax=Pleurodeles waltl TaxID=8319 RepID=A0AAV7V6R9_PLEWA|nr:hypothetical protein NDU88_000924 [Pleurodeles waltl]
MDAHLLQFIRLVLPRKTPPGVWPRSVIARILNYMDRYAILKYMCQHDKVMYQEYHIMIFPDYTKLVPQQPHYFATAKQHLCDVKIQYMLLDPAHLKVIFHAQALFFVTPEDVFHWTDERVMLKPHTPPGMDSCLSQGDRRNRTLKSARKWHNRTCSSWRRALQTGDP